MALHPEFPKSPYVELLPDQRWLPKFAVKFHQGEPLHRRRKGGYLRMILRVTKLDACESRVLRWSLMSLLISRLTISPS